MLLQEDDRWWDAVITNAVAFEPGAYVVKWADGKWSNSTSTVDESDIRSADPAEANHAARVKVEALEAETAASSAAKVMPTNAGNYA